MDIDMEHSEIVQQRRQQEEMELPNEILVRILARVDPALWLLTRRVNRQWNLVSTDLMLRIMNKSWDDLKQKESLRKRDGQKRTFAFDPLINRKNNPGLHEQLVVLHGHTLPIDWNPLHDVHRYNFPSNYDELCQYMISRDQVRLIPHAVRPSVERKEKIYYIELEQETDTCDEDDINLTSDGALLAEDETECRTESEGKKRKYTAAHAQRKKRKSSSVVEVPLFNITRATTTAFQYGHLHIAKQLIEKYRHKVLIDFKAGVQAAACRGDIEMARYIKSVTKDQRYYIRSLVESLLSAAKYGHARFFHFASTMIEKADREMLDSVMHTWVWLSIGARFPHHPAECNEPEASISQLIERYGSSMWDISYDFLLTGFALASRHDLFAQYYKGSMGDKDHLSAAVLAGNVETCKFLLYRHPKDKIAPSKLCVPVKNRRAFCQFLADSEEGQRLLRLLPLPPMIEVE